MFSSFEPIIVIVVDVAVIWEVVVVVVEIVIEVVVEVEIEVVIVVELVIVEVIVAVVVVEVALVPSVQWTIHIVSRNNWIETINRMMIEIAKIVVNSHFIIDIIILFLSSVTGICSDGGEEEGEEEVDVAVVVMSVR